MNTNPRRFWRIAFLAVSSLALIGSARAQPAADIPSAGSRLVAKAIAGATPRNIVLILSDDHRYDVMGFMGHPFVKTPYMDRLDAASTIGSASRVRAPIYPGPISPSTSTVAMFRKKATSLTS